MTPNQSDSGVPSAPSSPGSVDDQMIDDQMIDDQMTDDQMTDDGIAHAGTTPIGERAMLSSLSEGQAIVYAGNKITHVSAQLAAAFVPGDRVIVDPHTGEILHIPAAEHLGADAAVLLAHTAFTQLSSCSDDQISQFFVAFADRLADDSTFASIARANEVDVADARDRGRSVTRLILDDAMRRGMIEGLRGWADRPGERSSISGSWDHDDWSVVARRAPLGVVGFVFEGRPNVFADAAGVLRTGNTAVFRIGSDALATAKSIMDHAVTPALEQADLPAGSLGLLDSKAHAAGWALFSHPQLGLAVARGSGPVVAQLGAVATQHGVPVSAHGTGGAWLLVESDVEDRLGLDEIIDVVSGSLDRKVCNTLNTVCLHADVSDAVVTAVLDGIDDAARERGVTARLHVTETAWAAVSRALGDRMVADVEVTRAEGFSVEPFASHIAVEQLGREWEWEESPEVSIHMIDNLDAGIELFNRWSPRFTASVMTADTDRFEHAYQMLNAPFVGNGMTRWVDGQYALGTPELGLSNWQNGRMLGRGGILSGDGIFTVRYQADTPATLRRTPRTTGRS